MSSPLPIVLFTGVQRMARRMREMGFESACLIEPGEEVSSPQEVDHWIPYDPADLQSLERWASGWGLRHRVVAVINRREKRVHEHGHLASALGLPGITPGQAKVLRDKLLLREEIARCWPDLNPPFAVADLQSPFPPEVPSPFLVKPRNLFKSQLITLCQAATDWDRARGEISRLREPTERRHGVRLMGGFLAEEYVRGAEASLDVMVCSDGEVVFTPAVTLLPARHWDMTDFHVAVRRIPSTLLPHEEALARQAVLRLVSALGLRSTPLHVDLVVAHGKVFILDVGSRVGGYRSEMMELGFGAPLDPLALKLAMGGRPEWRPRWRKGVAVVELFPKRQGRLTGIKGLDGIKRLRSFHRLRQRTRPGEEVGWARFGYRCPLFVILAHQEPEVVTEEVELLPKLIDFQVEPL